MELHPIIPGSKDEIPRIRPDELKGLMDRGESVVVVDCNPQEVFDEEHIPGAISIAWNFQGLKEDPKLPKNKIIVAYCLCAHEEDSGDAALQMISYFGYRNIKLLLGGNSGWKSLGYPVQKTG